MQSAAWMNGQQQQVGPASQAAGHHTFYTVRTQQTGSANNSSHYRKVNMEVQQSQGANFNYQDGNVRQMYAWHRVTPHQTASFIKPGETNHNYIQLYSNRVDNTDNRNPCLQYSNQVPIQQQFHPSSSSNLTQSGTKKANAAYTQQDMLYWNQVNRKQTISMQEDQFMVNPQRYIAGRAALKNEKRNSNRAVSAYNTHATLQTVYPSSSVPGPAHMRQIVHTQSPRPTDHRDGFRPAPPPPYSEVVPQYFRHNNSNAANLSSSCQTFNRSNLRSQECPPQPNRMQETASAVNSNTQSRQFDFRSASSGVNGKALHYPPEVVRIAEILQASYPAESNQAVRPVTQNMVQTCNLNNTKISSHSRQYLPESDDCSITSGGQPVEMRPPQQSVCVGNGNAADGALLNRNLVGSSHESCQQMLAIERISPQKNQAQAFATNAQDIPAPGNPCDSSLHSSPGRSGARAVAVVQPLSQENCKFGTKSGSCDSSSQSVECRTTDESLSNQGKSCVLSDVAKEKRTTNSGKAIHSGTDDANQMKPCGFPAEHPAASGDGDGALSLDRSAGQNYLLRKLLSADNMESELALYMQAAQKRVTPSQQSVTSEVPISENSEKSEPEMPTDLSSIPETPWTMKMLTNLIKEEEKACVAPLDKAQSHFNSATKLLSMFWDHDRRLLVSKLKRNWYANLMLHVMDFCYKHVMTDTVVMSQVKKNESGNVLKNFHVLQDNEDYQAPVYKSSWLNVNQQLDDIDKEFGFPWSLKQSPNTLEAGSQPDEDETITDVPEETDDCLVNAGLETVGSDEDNQASAPSPTSNPTLSPNEMDSEGTNDPYSFQIQVLSPEKAKLVFQQIQSETSLQGSDLKSPQEEAMNSSEDVEMLEVTDVTIVESLVPDKSLSTLGEVCCIARLLETMGGSEVPILCQCKKDQIQKACADENPDEDATTTQENDEPSETNLASATEGETQPNCDGNATDHTVIGQPEPCGEQTPDATEEDVKSCSDKNQGSICGGTTTDSQSNISENGDEEIKSAEGSLSRNSDISKIKTNFSNAVASQRPDKKEDCASARSLESPPKTPQTNSASQTTFVPRKECDAVKRKRNTKQNSIDRYYPRRSDLKKCKLSVDPDSKTSGGDYKKDSVEVPDCQSPSPKRVELLLFGSAPTGKCSLTGSRTRFITSPEGLSKAGQMAPKVVAVSLSPLKTKDSPDCSIKERIREEWRRSFPPTKIKQKGRLKTFTSTFGSPSEMRKMGEKTGSDDPTEPPAPSEKRTRSQNIKRPLTQKRQSAHSNKGKVKEDKTKKDGVKPKQPTDKVASGPRGKNIPKFTVSPKKYKRVSCG